MCSYKIPMVYVDHCAIKLEYYVNKMSYLDDLTKSLHNANTFSVFPFSAGHFSPLFNLN